MQQVKEKCATARRFMAFILVTFLATAWALGQAGAPVRFDVPYAFTVGSKTLPAGTYTFSISPEASRLKVESTSNGSIGVSIITLIHGPNELFRGGSLVFERKNGGLILSEAWLSGSDGALVHSISKGGDRVVISGASLDANRTYSGKAAYSLTCARCHGDNGKGNPEADKFFGLTIPRLNTAEVQSKTDAQLREQITQGDSLMPPVEIDESGFRHRLPPQDVDAVIAYLRTLKQ
jgi:mono/diheme cytochrome c family protein